MANLQATFRSQVLVNDDCAVCITRTNTLLYRSTESTKFATMIYGALDPKTGQIKYTNGGHDCPILFRNSQEPFHVESTGLILGIFEDSDYTQETIQLEPGNLLLLFSDGITEAMDSEMEMYGTDRLQNLVQENIKKSVSEIASLILDDIKKHTKGTTQSDDITLMLIKKD
jgi:sigma-B regulation protein RsbU (phosphoserine phosphatase)